MTDFEKLELLKAALALAAADGNITRAELGVVQGLAARVGIGQASFDAMVAAARRGNSLSGGIAMHKPETARKALRLLVGQARIDGEIHDKERRLLLWIGAKLRLTGDEFQEIYAAGIRDADRLLRRPR